MAGTKKAEKKVTPPVSSKYIAAGAGRALDLDACDVSGKVRILRVECTVPKGQEADSLVIGRLPSGHSLFLGHLSMIEVSEVPKDCKFYVGLGERQEPLGERLKADTAALVKTKELKTVQTLLGSLDKAKVRAIAPVEVIMTLTTPLPAGTVVRGYLAYSTD